MGHPAIDNRSPFACELTFLTDEDGRPTLIVLVTATYQIRSRGKLALAEVQASVPLAGAFWGDPETSSHRYEPQIALEKPGTDVVLRGHACAREPDTRELDVTLNVGPVRKTIRVIGDREWVRSLGRTTMTSPMSFERVPLVYERAFGGFDRSSRDPAHHGFEARNPVGRGYRGKHTQFEGGILLPNLEDPRRLLRSDGDTPAPAAFGFVSPQWEPRVKFSGTYDGMWARERMPLLPRDFDRRFFNAAPADQIVPDGLGGDEAVLVSNVVPEGRVSFRLPRIPPPQAAVELARRPDGRVRTKLDTVIIDTDESLLRLVWRGHLGLVNGPHDVRSVAIRTEGTSERTAPVAA